MKGFHVTILSYRAKQRIFCALMPLLLTGCGDIVWPGELDHQKHQMEKLPTESVWETQLMNAYTKTRTEFLKIDPHATWDPPIHASGQSECNLGNLRDMSGEIGIDGSANFKYVEFGTDYTLAKFPSFANAIEKNFAPLGFREKQRLQGYIQFAGPGKSSVTLSDPARASLEIDTGCHLKSKAKSNAPATSN